MDDLEIVWYFLWISVIQLIFCCNSCRRKCWSQKTWSDHTVIKDFRSYCGIIPTFVGKQIFAGSWGHYFVGKLYDVTREDISNFICFSKYGKSYLSHILLGKITLFDSDGSLCKHFDTSMRPVIAGKWNHQRGFRTRWTVKSMIAITITKSLWLMLISLRIAKNKKK